MTDEPVINKAFSERINTIIPKDASIAEVAKSLGVHRETIYAWKRGDQLPKGICLYHLKRMYGISIDWLLTGEENRTEGMQGSERDPELRELKEQLQGLARQNENLTELLQSLTRQNENLTKLLLRLTPMEEEEESLLPGASEMEAG